MTSEMHNSHAPLGDVTDHTPSSEAAKNKPPIKNQDLEKVQQKSNLFQSKYLQPTSSLSNNEHQDYSVSTTVSQLFKPSVKAGERSSSTLPTVVLYDEEDDDLVEEDYSSSDSSSVGFFEDNDDDNDANESLQDSFGILWIQSPTRGAKKHLELDITSFLASLPKTVSKSQESSVDLNHNSFSSAGHNSFSSAGGHGSFNHSVSFDETTVPKQQPSSATVSGTTSSSRSNRTTGTSSRTTGTTQSSSRRRPRRSSSAMAAASSILAPKMTPKIQKPKVQGGVPAVPINI